MIETPAISARPRSKTGITHSSLRCACKQHHLVLHSPFLEFIVTFNYYCTLSVPSSITLQHGTQPQPHLNLDTPIPLCPFSIPFRYKAAIIIHQLTVPIIPTNIFPYPHCPQIPLLLETSKLAFVLNRLVRPPRGAEAFGVWLLALKGSRALRDNRHRCSFRRDIDPFLGSL